MSMEEWSERTSEEHDWPVKVEYGLVLLLMLVSTVFAAISLMWPTSAAAHPGGLAADGCHNDRKNGGRHCHGVSAPRVKEPRSAGPDVHYLNCADARAAGAAPVRRGQPGYAKHLDRDGDGIGCE